MSKGNNPIGECPCPFSGCAHKARVMKFQMRALTDTKKRFAGKLFLVCPEHGRLGLDGKIAFQNYVLEHAKIWGNEKPGDAAAPVTPQESPLNTKVIPAAPVARTAPAPSAVTRSSPVEPPKKSEWGTLLG